MHLLLGLLIEPAVDAVVLLVHLMQLCAGLHLPFCFRPAADITNVGKYPGSVSGQECGSQRGIDGRVPERETGLRQLRRHHPLAHEDELLDEYRLKSLVRKYSDHITLPILKPGLIISALFAFVQSFDETVVAIFISGRNAATLPRKMFDSIRQEADPVIAVVSTLLFVLVLIGIVAPPLWKARIWPTSASPRRQP